MEPKNLERQDCAISAPIDVIEELEEKIAPGFLFDTVWPFPSPNLWGR